MVIQLVSGRVKLKLQLLPPKLTLLERHSIFMTVGHMPPKGPTALQSPAIKDHCCGKGSLG